MSRLPLAAVIILLSVHSLLSSTYFQQRADYTINVTLDPQNRSYSGNQTLVYRNNSPDTLEYVWVHLYMNAFRNNETPYARQQKRLASDDYLFAKAEDRGFIDVTSLRQNGNELTREFKDDAIDELKVFLEQPLLPGQSATLDFEFEGQLPYIFSRMGHYQRTYFSMSFWYPKVAVYDTYGWHPDSYLDLGEFYSDFGDFDVRITLPAQFMVDGTGTRHPDSAEKIFLQQRQDEAKRIARIRDKEKRSDYWQGWQQKTRAGMDYDSLKTVRFSAENVTDFAWFCGPDYLLLSEITADSVLVNVMVRPENAYDWQAVPRYVKQTLDFYGRYVGSYAWPKAAVVDGSYITFGGMEYPMITNISVDYVPVARFLEQVVVHEVGHYWFYGMLASNERADIFLDEGINSFYEQWYMRHYHGRINMTSLDSLGLGWMPLDDIGQWELSHLSFGALAVQNKDQILGIDDASNYTVQSYANVAYEKAAFMLQAMRWTVGQEKFDAAMRVYFERWKFRHPQNEDFFAIMQQETGYDLTGFRREWMETTEYCDFELESVDTKRTASGYETTIEVSNSGGMKHTPAPVHLVTVAGDTLEGRWNGEAGGTVTIVHETSVDFIEVNLKRDIFELSYLNNRQWPRGDISFLNFTPSWEVYKTVLYPYLGYEYFNDGVRAGLGFVSGNFLTKEYLLHGNAYYGLASDQIGYSLKFSHRLSGFLLNYSDVSAEIYDKTGLKRLSAFLTTYLRQRDDVRFINNITLSLHDVKMYDNLYNEPGIFAEARYSSAAVELESRHRHYNGELRGNLRYEQSLDLANSDWSFGRVEGSLWKKLILNPRWQFTADIYGTWINGDAIPNQELIFAGGQVDPKHLNTAPARRGASAYLRHFASHDPGMNMYGYASQNFVYPAGRAGLAAGLEMDVPLLPVTYGRAALLSSDADKLFEQKWFYEAGFKFGESLINLILPIWVSDPLANEDNFEWRWMVRVNMPAISW